MIQLTEVPADFLKLARAKGLPKKESTEFYAAKINHKPFRHLASQLSSGNYFKDESEAGKVLANTWAEYVKLNQDFTNISPDISSAAVAYERVDYPSYLELAREGLEKTIGRLKIPVPVVKKYSEKDRIAVAGDFHGIFCDESAFAKLCADPAETLVLMGDFLDLYAATRYRSTLDYVTIREELANGRARAEELSRHFKKIYFMLGNHDTRSAKKIQDVAPHLMPLFIDPMDLLTQDLLNWNKLLIKIPGTRPNIKFGTDHTIEYAGVIGDALFGHFENFCGADAPKNLEKWINDWQHVIKLPPIKAIFQAHNHALNMTYTPQGRLLASTGCMSKPFPYQFDKHGSYNPPAVGYLAIYQPEGITDLRRTEFIFLGSK